jgi:hypothetical protein
LAYSEGYFVVVAEMTQTLNPEFSLL